MKRRIKRKVVKFFMLICIIVFVYSLYNIVSLYLNTESNDKINRELKELIKIEEIEESEGEKKEELVIDFNGLKEQNADTVGYLKVNNTKIDYIVVKGTDNEYYLKHNFEKKSNSAGWIFADYKNKFDGTDRNIVVYGHNMLNGSMFGSLKNTQKPEWYKDESNYIIIFATEMGNFKYEVFSIYTIKNEEYYIQTEFSNNDAFDKFVKTVKKRSKYNFGVEVSGEDQILTLSTCSGNGKYRSVLHARKLNPQE